MDFPAWANGDAITGVGVALGIIAAGLVIAAGVALGIALIYPDLAPLLRPRPPEHDDALEQYRTKMKGLDELNTMALEYEAELIANGTPRDEARTRANAYFARSARKYGA